MNLLFTLFAFFIAISILITIHELGHYSIGRLFNVKILRFSIGIGKPLFRFKAGADNTEYTISALPLGGYVKFYGEKNVDIPEQDKHRAFCNQPLINRSLIVAAGPIFNFILAIFAFWIVSVVGATGLAPIIDDTTQGSPAHVAGIRAGDEIIRINNVNTPTWRDARHALLKHSLDSQEATLIIKSSDNTTRFATIDLSNPDIKKKPALILNKLGIRQVIPEAEPIIDSVIPGSPSDSAGLIHKDKIITADDIGINAWSDIAAYVRANPAKTITLGVQRDNEIVNIYIIPDAVSVNGDKIGRIGATPLPVVTADNPLFRYVSYGPIESVRIAFIKSYDISILSIKMIWLLLSGEISITNVSGPVSIAQYAGVTANEGAVTFIAFIALVSISVGILNLLPVPILDGGHLVLYAIEAIRRRPASDAFIMQYQKLGLIMLLCMFGVAMYSDIAKLIA